MNWSSFIAGGIAVTFVILIFHISKSLIKLWMIDVIAEERLKTYDLINLIMKNKEKKKR